LAARCHLRSPIIVVSGAIGEEYAAKIIKAGAYDYVLKQNLQRLASTIKNAIEHHHLQLLKAEMEVQLKESNAQLRELTKRMALAIEAERLRVSREIHDEIGGNLAVIKMDVRWVQRHTHDNNADVVSKLETIANITDATIVSMRSIISNLRPTILDDLGLFAAIEWLMGDCKRHYSVEFEYHAENVADLRLSDSEELAVFRIIQESITNAVKHAEARHVYVAVTYINAVLTVSVGDDGIGMQKNQANTGYGLLGMRERAENIGAKFHIVTSSAGSEIRLELAKN